MKYRSWLVIGIALTGLLTACSRAQNPPAAPWDEAKARATALAISKGWKFFPEDFKGDTSTNLQHDVYAVLPFDDAETSRWLLLIATEPPDNTCHACAPVTGAVIFARKDGSWQAVYDQSHVLDTGAFGKPPSAGVRNLGPSKPAVELEFGAMAQGFESTGLTLVAEVNHTLRQVLSIPIGESNEATGAQQDQTFRWQAKVETSQSVHEGFADVIVTFSGTKAVDDGSTIRPYSGGWTYQFNGEVYKKVE
jgi:hypothetical protein